MIVSIQSYITDELEYICTTQKRAKSLCFMQFYVVFGEGFVAFFGTKQAQC